MSPVFLAPETRLAQDQRRKSKVHKHVGPVGFRTQLVTSQRAQPPREARMAVLDEVTRAFSPWVQRLQPGHPIGDVVSPFQGAVVIPLVCSGVEMKIMNILQRHHSNRLPPLSLRSERKGLFQNGVPLKWHC